MGRVTPRHVSAGERSLVSRFVAERPWLRESMRTAPPTPMLWWHLLSAAEVAAGIRHSPPVRALLN
jgi:hypothetical protein